MFKAGHSTPKLVAVLMSAMLLASACGDDSGSSESENGTETTATNGGDGRAADMSLEPVTIGVVSQEKDLIALPEISYVARAYEQYVNAELGGIDGHPLSVQVCLSGDRPETTQACVQELVNDDDVLAVVLGTADTVTGWRITTDAGVPTLVGNVDPSDAKTEGVYTLDAGAIGQALVIGSHLSNLPDVDSVSLLCLNDPNLVVICDGTESGIEGKGIDVRNKILVDPETADMVGPVTALEADEVDALVAVMPGELCDPFARAVDQLNIDLPVVVIDSCLTESLIADGLVDGWSAAFNSSLGDSAESASDATKEARRSLTEYGDGDPMFLGLSGWMYGNMEFLFEVLTEIGPESLSREAVNTAMSEFDQTLPSYGPVKCPGPGDWIGLCHPTSIMMTVTDGGLATATDYIDVAAEYAEL